MNINKLNEGELGYNVTIVTISGNKIQGTIVKDSAHPDILKIKTDNGITMLNSEAIESIY